MLSSLMLASLILWLVIFLLPWRPWSVVESLDVALDDSVANLRQADFPTVTVLIPARNEADLIEQTLTSLSAQNIKLKIILIDDQSTDQTISVAESVGIAYLEIIQGQALPSGWSGKLWALEQGLQVTNSELILLLDADIKLRPDILPTLLEKMWAEDLDLISLMAQLRMNNFWEKLLMPAFIYFFKLLYPFKLSNQGHPLVAAAAGGCVLLKREALLEIGGFAALKSALIDDCTLARKFRQHGKSTWIGLTHSALSLRPCARLGDTWNMVARTAFTQLQYSALLLLLCVGLMSLAYLVPLVALPHFPLLALLTLALMFVSYLPVILYYNLNPFWVFGLPLAGVLYLLMTLTSAYRYYAGERSRWKGRTYS